MWVSSLLECAGRERLCRPARGASLGMACIMRSWGSFVLNQYGFSSSGGVAGLFVGGYREISLPSGGGEGGVGRGWSGNAARTTRKHQTYFLQYMTLKPAEATGKSLAACLTWQQDTLNTLRDSVDGALRSQNTMTRNIAPFKVQTPR